MKTVSHRSYSLQGQEVPKAKVSLVSRVVEFTVVAAIVGIPTVLLIVPMMIQVKQVALRLPAVLVRGAEWGVRAGRDAADTLSLEEFLPDSAPGERAPKLFVEKPKPAKPLAIVAVKAPARIVKVVPKSIHPRKLKAKNSLVAPAKVKIQKPAKFIAVARVHSTNPKREEIARPTDLAKGEESPNNRPLRSVGNETSRTVSGNKVKVVNEVLVTGPMP
jgi:hypothetical protein